MDTVTEQDSLMRAWQAGRVSMAKWVTDQFTIYFREHTSEVAFLPIALRLFLTTFLTALPVEARKDTPDGSL